MTSNPPSPKKPVAAPKKPAVASKPAQSVTKTHEKPASKNLAGVEKVVSKPAMSYVMQKGEEYMSAQQLAYFSQLLNDWKTEINQNSIDALNALQADTGSMADLNDRATLEEEFTLTLRSQDRERRLIQKINKAIDRIQSEDFGFCERCGSEIGLQRLEARLTAELCIDCKEIEEKLERTLSDH